MHRILTGNKKWIYFYNPKRKRLWTNPKKAIKINWKTQYSWEKNLTLHKVKPKCYFIL